MWNSPNIIQNSFLKPVFPLSSERNVEIFQQSHTRLEYTLSTFQKYKQHKKVAKVYHHHQPPPPKKRKGKTTGEHKSLFQIIGHFERELKPKKLIIPEIQRPAGAETSQTKELFEEFIQRIKKTLITKNLVFFKYTKN